MRFLYVIDPLAQLNLDTETSLLLMEEAARRGHENLICTIDDLYLDDTLARARVAGIRLDLSQRPFYRLAPVLDAALDAFDLVLMRKDPPVDAKYVMATYILEQAARRVPVVNNPASLRTVNEKLLPLQFPQFAPPTLVTSDLDRVAAFAAQHGRTILKPLDDCSGRGIRIVAAGAPIPQEWAGQFLMVQRFIPEVAEGDKRILVLDGEILGAVNRIPRGPDALANIHQGARVVATTITPRDREIVTAITPLLRERGLWLAGIDVIGGYLTEINVTSPSAARQINTVSGTQIEKPVVDFLEAMARHRQVQRG